ncbi:uncharacterized protein LOC122634980 isoform X1 [Vespula pensylvanica]|uniref:uncharacterized protein LOC122634980 isoform X1 n=1 Tax=Vespula pensylvanica TaxID=30213 RepID=UPI001CBA4306|nr:uncharacterized protein LOC122634980 isoform X1 [Vespula pensylvanica]
MLMNIVQNKESVFLPCDDEVEDLEPIQYNIPASYSEKVKIHNWQMNTLAEPKDNKDIFPPKGNLQNSTYKRLGSFDEPMGISETHAMLSQIEFKDLYKSMQPHRGFLKMLSFVRTEREEQEEEPKLEDIIYSPEEMRCMDYRTTTEIEYRAPYPMKSRPPPQAPPPVPWLLNRRTIGYTLEDLQKYDGVVTFLDENMKLQQCIADLKKERNKMRDIISSTETSVNSSYDYGSCQIVKKDENEYQCHE